MPRHVPGFEDIVHAGSATSDLPHTDAPVSFKRLQIVMNTAGFTLFRFDPESPILHWEHVAGRMITTLMPDYRADGFSDPVYDLGYVRDLLPKLTNDGTPNSDTGRKLLVTLFSITNEPY